MSIKLNAQSGGSVALDAPTQTTGSADVTLKLPVADGTANQVIKTDGSGNLSFATPTLPHAFVFMDSQYFTSTTTLLAFNPSTANDQSSGVTIDRTNERFTPTTAGVYLVQAVLVYSHGGSAGYTPTVYIYKNGSSFVYASNIINYSGGDYDSVTCQAMISMNGSSDYVDMRGTHNGGGNATMFTTSTFSMFRIGA